MTLLHDLTHPNFGLLGVVSLPKPPRGGTGLSLTLFILHDFMPRNHVMFAVTLKSGQELRGRVVCSQTWDLGDLMVLLAV
jgi:hypothetical protein